MFCFLFFFCAGSGVQDQLDALAIPPTTPEDNPATETQPQNSDGDSGSVPEGGGGDSTATNAGCNQCMGLSQLSFAASTLTPAAVHNNSLHLVEGRGSIPPSALTTFMQQGHGSAAAATAFHNARHHLAGDLAQEITGTDVTLNVSLNTVKAEDEEKPVKLTS